MVRFDRPCDAGDEAAFLRIGSSTGGGRTLRRTASALLLCPADRAVAGPKPAPNTVFGGRAFLHDAADMTRRLGLPAGSSPIAIINAAFEARGSAGLSGLRGVFSFVHWDESRRRLTLTRDCGRGEALYFFRGRDIVVFATHLADLLAFPDVPRDVDEAVLANQVLSNLFQRRRTVLRSVERVPSRTAIIITRGAIDECVYWAPVIVKSRLYARDEDYVERARELLDQAVARVLSDSPKFVVKASGGLDSSAVLSTLARRGIDDIPCYTLVPEGPAPASDSLFYYDDERPKTAALASRYPALRFRYLSAADLVASPPPDEARFERWPLPQFNVSRGRVNDALNRAIVDDGYGVVLTGAAGNLSLSWAGEDLMPDLAARGRLLALWREVLATAREEGNSPLRILAHGALLPLLPDAAKEMLMRRLGQAGHLIDARSPFRPEAAREFHFRETWQADGFDPVVRWVRWTRELRIARLFDKPAMMHDYLPANDAVHGIELRDPLADRDLCEFCLNVPSRLFRRDGVPRWFARAVLADRVPSELLDERRRGSQRMPWSIAIDRTQLATEIDRMEHSLAASRLFDVPRLKRLVSDWPEDVEEDFGKNLTYMAVEQAVYVFRYMRWLGRGNA